MTEGARGSAAPGAWSRSPWRLLLERVLDLLAGILEIARDLVSLALGLNVLVPGGLADTLLDLPLELLALVVGLVFRAHGRLPSWCRRHAAASLHLPGGLRSKHRAGHGAGLLVPRPVPAGDDGGRPQGEASSSFLGPGRRGWWQVT